MEVYTTGIPNTKEISLLIERTRTLFPSLVLRGNMTTGRGNLIIREEVSGVKWPSAALTLLRISVVDQVNTSIIAKLLIKDKTVTYAPQKAHSLNQPFLELVKEILPPLQSQAVADDGSARRQPRKPGRHYPGDQIDAYKLVERLGSGRSGEVWSAQVTSVPPGVDQLKLDSKVALKLYFPQIFSAHSETIRIQREFQAASELDHEALVKVYDVLLSPSRGYAFMAMELVSGVSLKSAIPSNGMKLKPTFEVARQLFSALSALHSAGALHRDVKAANILVERDKPEEKIKIKLCDLGIVSIVSDHELTGTSVFLGSKHSSPLEQLVGGRVDERTDLYGAASVVFHTYLGRPMYAGIGPEAAIAVRIERGQIENLLPRPEDTPQQAFFDLINRCLSREPSSRPSSARVCVEELARISI